MMTWLTSRLSVQQVALIIGSIMAVATVFAVVNAIDNAITDAYTQGRKEVLLEMREATADLRDRVSDADKGTGDAQEDLDWILGQLDDLGVQLNDTPDGAAPASP